LDLKCSVCYHKGIASDRSHSGLLPSLHRGGLRISDLLKKYNG